MNVRGGADGKTPLLWAATGPHPELVALLLEAGADPLVRDALGRDAITEEMRIWRKGYLGRVERMLSRVRPPQDLSVIAMIAAGDAGRLAAWLAADPDLEVRWDLERTPLLWAVYYDAEDFALALIARGARFEVEDYRGDTPLHFAARNGNLRLARRFLAAGADPDRANAYGQTPLALSLFAPDTSMLEHLLARGADPCIGPNGRSDVLDLARSTRTGNEAAAIALLEPVFANRRCRESPERARRANARAFTDRLRELTPPPAWVLDDSLDLAVPSRGDELVAATQHYYESWMRASSREEVEALVRMRRANGYRALLDHPDDESFAFLGSGIWKPKLHPEDAETALRIEALRSIHFPHFRTDEACLHCDPDEHVKGKRASLAALSYSRALLREARLLQALDVLEKFTRERINETMPFFRSALDEDRVRLMWLLGRREEARALGEALVIERYGSYPRQGKKPRLEYVLDHLRHEREAQSAATSAATSAASSAASSTAALAHPRPGRIGDSAR